MQKLCTNFFVYKFLCTNFRVQIFMYKFYVQILIQIYKYIYETKIYLLGFSCDGPSWNMDALLEESLEKALGCSSSCSGFMSTMALSPVDEGAL